MKKLGELAGADLKTVHYVIREDEHPNAKTGVKEWTCVVSLGSPTTHEDETVVYNPDDFVKVACVGKGTSRAEVRTRAAEVAYNTLKGYV